MNAGQRLRRAIASRVVYLAIQGGSSLAIFALLARSLSVSELDAAATALAVFVTVQAICDLGLSHVATSQIPRHARRDPAEATRVAAAIARMAGVTAAASVAMTAAAALLVPASARPSVLAIAPAAGAAVVVTAAESLARARDDVVTPMRLALTSRCAFFVVSPLLLLHPPPAAAVALFTASMLVGSIPAFRRVAAVGAGHPGAPLTIIAGTALAIGCAGALVAIGTRGVVVVLANVGGTGAVAAFEASWRVYQVFMYAAGAVATAIVPYAAGALAAGGVRGLRRAIAPTLAALALGGIAAGALVYALAAPFAAAMLGEDLPAAERATRALALALPASFVLYGIQTAVAVPLVRLRALLLGGAALCAVTVGVTFALAPDEGAAGAAIAVLCGQLAMLAVLAVDLLAGRPSQPAAAQDGADGGREDA